MVVDGGVGVEDLLGCTELALMAVQPVESAGHTSPSAPAMASSAYDCDLGAGVFPLKLGQHLNNLFRVLLAFDTFQVNNTSFQVQCAEIRLRGTFAIYVELRSLAHWSRIRRVSASCTTLTSSAANISYPLSSSSVTC